MSDSVALDEGKGWKALAEAIAGLFVIELIIVGFFGWFGFDALAQWSFLAVGVLLVGLGLADLGFAVGMREMFQSWRRSCVGLGWQIVVFLAGVVAFPVGWFIASWPADITYNAVSDIYSFSGVAADAVSLVRVLIGLLVGVGLFLLIIWLWVNSNRKGQIYG